MNTTQPIILLFRYDLRLSDHIALSAAVKSGNPIIPCYILDEHSPGEWTMGGASRWWLHHSLSSLQASLTAKGGDLILRRGQLQEQLLKLVNQVNASAVYWTRMYEPHFADIEQQLNQLLTAQGVTAKRFPGYLLFEPEDIRTNSDGPFKVFTPFWRACLKQSPVKKPLTVPRQINFYKNPVTTEALTDWHLLPTKPDWAHGIRDSWQPGEKNAKKLLKTFLQQGLPGYQKKRDQPALPNTSRLSPHLHFGEISPRQVWYTIQIELALTGEHQQDTECFLREIGWREFSYHLLQHWPTLPSIPFRPQFAHFPWRKDQRALRAWQQGQTGFPLVDAGMRELWHTGWMHNRVRMVVASFLVKNLLIHWHDGETWFWDTLVDADLANNAASWQWVAGSGADAAPYFRIFNPVTQSEKFDPDGTYIKKWVPELKNLSGKYLHRPWEASDSLLQGAGITLGRDYPKPIADLKVTRQRALDAYSSISTKTNGA